jgi:phage shock protein A
MAGPNSSGRHMAFLNRLLRRLLLQMEERLARPRPDLLTKHVNQIVLDLSNAMIEAKKNVASAIADEKRLACQRRQEVANGAEWEARARRALDAGNEDLAKEALERKTEHDATAALVHARWAEQKKAIDDLKQRLRALNDRVEEAKRKKVAILGFVTRDSARRSVRRLSIVLEEATAALDELERLGRAEEL